MVGIKIDGISKTFINGQCEKHVLEDINLYISKGEVLGIRGDNGCGKTTLLNIVAGIIRPTSGTISFEGLNKARPLVGYTQQDYTSSLLPWFNVLENVAIPLRLQDINTKNRKQKAKEFLARLGFDSLPELSYPYQLSGGQKQRVAFARAFIHEPHIVLLDEPFANLDAHTTRDLEDLLSRIQTSSRPTMLFVSHELANCIYLADRVVILNGSPARIVFDESVPLPRPRTRDMIYSSVFLDLRARILATEERLYGKK